MASSSVIGAVLAAIVAVCAGAAWFNGDLYPIVVYLYTYVTEGKGKAEDKALEAMGESRGSYFLKDQLKSSKEASQAVDAGQKQYQNVNKLGDGLTGGAVSGVQDNLTKGFGIK
ncbi:MAG: hypothetical protein M1827_004643 [Pycnora praestabilis]|nr:MAG: hypothetical protein M1827_004643 [Pycnora praestabilis]